MSRERIPSSGETSASIDDDSDEDDDGNDNSPTLISLKGLSRDRAMSLIAKLRVLRKLKYRIARNMSWRNFITLIKRQLKKSRKKSKRKLAQSLKHLKHFPLYKPSSTKTTKKHSTKTISQKKSISPNVKNKEHKSSLNVKQSLGNTHSSKLSSSSRSSISLKVTKSTSQPSPQVAPSNNLASPQSFVAKQTGSSAVNTKSGLHKTGTSDGTKKTRFTLFGSNSQTTVEQPSSKSTGREATKAKVPADESKRNVDSNNNREESHSNDESNKSTFEWKTFTDSELKGQTSAKVNQGYPVHKPVPSPLPPPTTPFSLDKPANNEATRLQTDSTKSGAPSQQGTLTQSDSLGRSDVGVSSSSTLSSDKTRGEGGLAVSHVVWPSASTGPEQAADGATVNLQNQPVSIGTERTKEFGATAPLRCESDIKITRSINAYYWST